MTIDANHTQRCTETQAKARALADVLLAGAPSEARRPEKPVADAWNRFGYLAKALASQKMPQFANQEKSFNAAIAAIERMQCMPEGAALVGEMPTILKRRGKVIAQIGVNFMDREAFPPDETDAEHTEAGGFFAPTEPDAPGYQIYVALQPDAGPRDRLKPEEYRLGASTMADTLFHELLHVWFIHKVPDQGLGHSGNPSDRRFRERLDRFQKQLHDFEKAMPKP